jgi:hypothetical protein
LDMNSNATMDVVGDDVHHHPQSMFALPAPDCLLPDAPASSWTSTTGSR